MVSGEYPYSYLVKLPANDEGEATWAVNTYKQLIRSFIFKKDASQAKSCPTDTKVHFEKFILSNAATSQNSFAARVARAAVELGVLETREYGYEKLNNCVLDQLISMTIWASFHDHLHLNVWLMLSVTPTRRSDAAQVLGAHNMVLFHTTNRKTLWENNIVQARRHPLGPSLNWIRYRHVLVAKTICTPSEMVLR
jgi:hypothetical protein